MVCSTRDGNAAELRDLHLSGAEANYNQLLSAPPLIQLHLHIEYMHIF